MTGQLQLTSRITTLPDQEHIGTGYYGSLHAADIYIFLRQRRISLWLNGTAARRDAAGLGAILVLRKS